MNRHQVGSAKKVSNPTKLAKHVDQVGSGSDSTGKCDWSWLIDPMNHKHPSSVHGGWKASLFVNSFSGALDSPEFAFAEFPADVDDNATAFCLPSGYQSGHAYPLIVWLHPTGNGPDQLHEIMPRVSDQNYIGVALAGTEILDEGRYQWLQSSEAIELTSNRIDRLVEIVKQEFNIHPDRIYLGGMGDGGTMAFRVAFRRPGRFGGVVSMNGSLPSNLNPLSNWLESRSLPVFWSHGRQSLRFPETNLCHQLRLLHVAGFDVTLRQYPCMDDIPDQMFSDLNRWIMERIAKSGANVIS